jgi:predicted transcriptional regulator
MCFTGKQQMNFILDSDLCYRLKTLATREHLSMSVLAQRAIEALLQFRASELAERDPVFAKQIGQGQSCKRIIEPKP